MSARRSVRKNVRKSVRKSALRSVRKSVRKNARKSVRRSARKSVRRSARKSVRRSARKSARRSARKSARRSARRSAQYVIPQQHLNNLINQAGGPMPMVRPRRRGSLTKEQQMKMQQSMQRFAARPQPMRPLQRPQVSDPGKRSQNNTDIARKNLTDIVISQMSRPPTWHPAPPAIPPRQVPAWARQPAAPSSGHGYVPFGFFGKNPETGM